MAEQEARQLGNYRLIRRLGRGGMAEVYLGEHVFLNTQAAIKILQAPLPEQDMPAFLREARLIAGLTHVNIVRVLDFGVQDETFYLVMEYAPGGTLRQNYPPGTRLSPATVAGLIRPIADALQYAHDQHVIHCDVKPENVLLSKDNGLLLSDFGISLVLQTMNVQQMQHIAGTIAYMAPEQFGGKPQKASDQYALAVVAYEWLSGERPFQGNFAEVSSQHLHAQVAPLSSKVPGLASALDEVLNTALAKDPARRFVSVSAFARALELACADTAGEVLPTGQTVWRETVAPVGNPVLTPEMLDVMSPRQEATLPAGPDTPVFYQRDTDGQRTPLPSFLPSGALSLSPERRTPARETSRRAFLIGAGVGGVVLIGAAAALLASGKLAPLLGSGSAATPGTTPVVTAPPVQRPTSAPTQAQSTSNIPLGSTLTTYTGQSQDVTGVCWSPVGSSRLVASCSQDGSAAIWNALTGSTVRSFPQSGALSTIVWSPNGQYLAFAGDNANVEIWGADSGDLIATCTGHTQPVRGLAWSPDSQRIVSASQDHNAIVWNASTGGQLRVFSGHTDYVWVAAWAPNGGSIATGSWDNTVQIWNPTTGEVIQRYTATQPVRAVDWSPDSSMVASGGDDDSVQVWQVNSGSVLATYRGHSNHIEAVQWSPDGRRIASASKDGTAQIWQSSNAGSIYTYRGHNALVWTLAWSPDGQLIVTGSADKTAQVWQAV